MKSLNSIFYFVLLIAAFSCSRDDEPTAEPRPDANKAPTIPLLKLPQDNLQCSYSNLTFEWEPSEDPEEGWVKYELEISESEAFSQLSHDRATSYTSVNMELESGNLYYWRVRAVDRKGLVSEYSKVRSLTTEPVLSINHVPYPAYQEDPADNATIGSNKVLLKWTGEDADGDALSYDLYFSTTNPPELYEEDLQENSFEINLKKGITYYWKINVTDGKGAKAIGEIWTFTSVE